MPAEKDYKAIEKATIYDLRRLFKNSDKATYTKEELCGLLDTIADAKDQERPKRAGEIPGPFDSLDLPVPAGGQIVFMERSDDRVDPQEALRVV